MTIPENKQNKKLSSLPFGWNTFDFSVHLNHRAADGHKQQAVSNPTSRFRVSPG
jgi:hypothetical protein